MNGLHYDSEEAHEFDFEAQENDLKSSVLLNSYVVVNVTLKPLIYGTVTRAQPENKLVSLKDSKRQMKI